jgi:heptosyltransferase I
VKNNVNTNPKILIVRLSAIGDCIETIPMVAAIKRHWPDSRITWLVDCGVDAILKTQPIISKVIRVKKGFLKRPSELLSLRKELLAEKFDISIDPQGLFKSAALGWLSGAKRRIGFASPQSREKAWWLYHDAVTPQSLHLVDRQIELLKPLSIPLPPAQHAPFDWVEPTAVAIEAESMLNQIGVQPKSYLSVNASAGWPSRVWPRERYAEVIRESSDLHQLNSVVIWGSPQERETAEWIVENSGTPRAFLAPPTQLMSLSGLLKRSLAYLGSDTGPMHLSAAVGARCIALFGSTRASYSGAYGRDHICIQKIDDSEKAGKKSSDDNSAMQAIAVKDVMRSIHSLRSVRDHQA